MRRAIKRKIIGRKTPRSVVRVGDFVLITVGGQRMKGKVVEDRGRIGFGGRNLYRISLQTDSAEPRSIELPAEESTITRRASPLKKVVRSKLRKVKPIGTQSHKKRETTIA